MAQLYPVEVRLTEEEVVALDEACAIWGLAGGDGRSRFIQRCLRYGPLCYSMRECWSSVRPRSLNSCNITETSKYGSRPPAPSATGQLSSLDSMQSKRAFHFTGRWRRSSRVPVQLALLPAPATSRLRFAPPASLVRTLSRVPASS